MKHLLKQRSEVIQKIRQFFYSENFIEVETPILSKYASVDVHLDSFETAFEQAKTSIHPMYLQTSPEFHMKRLLSEESGSIFQITKAFRNGEVGRKHNPEFSILEWYRIDYDYKELMQQVEQLINSVLGLGQYRYITYEDAFVNSLKVNPYTISNSDLNQLVATYDIELSKSLHTRDEMLDYLFTHCIEPKLAGRTFIYNYPKSQAALAQINPTDPRTACRFELYIDGIELCNGFEELTDAHEQEQRFILDNRERLRLGKKELPYDRLFIEALKRGMPKCSGVAVGLDRLIMIALKKSSLEEVIAFPYNKT